MRVRWALCKREDIIAFKADLQSQVGAIELLLSTLQLTKQDRNDRATDRVSETVDRCSEQLAKLTTWADDEAERSNDLLRQSRTLVQQNELMMMIVRESQKSVWRLPTQIERQQPVYFRDALDKDAPFHLEFVRSAEALLCVLRVNLTHVPSGQDKVDRGEFSISESPSNRTIDLSQQWETCFYPGQTVGMSVLFHLPRGSSSDCPACGQRQDEPATHDVQCSSCGTTIRRTHVRDLDFEQRPTYRQLIDRAQRRNSHADEDVHPFRRIHVLDYAPDTPSVSAPNTDIHAFRHATETLAPETPASATKSQRTPPRRSKGCLRIIERQALCRCILREHAIDHGMPCTCFGDRARVTTKEVLVAYACLQHPSSSPGASHLSTYGATPEAQGSDGCAAYIIPPYDMQGDLPTPPSSLPRDPIPVLARGSEDMRGGVCGLETPPESPERKAAEWESAEPERLDLAEDDGEMDADEGDLVEERAERAKEGGRDVRTYLPKTMPVAIPIRMVREAYAYERDGNGGSWRSSFG